MKTSLTLLLAMISFAASAQQDPLYAQYLNNPLLLNPAYSGASENWRTVAGYRTQWSGFEGNPNTFNLTSSMSLLDNRMGIGLIISQDKIGENKNTEINATYSYRIQHGERNFFFGLSAGVIRFQSDPGQLNLKDPTDPSFRAMNESRFNTGVGFLIKDERWTAGISAPRLLPAKVSVGGESIQVYDPHFYIYGGYIIFLNERWRFKPAALIRATSGAPLSADIQLNAILDEVYNIGLITRNLNTYGVLLQAKMGDYRIGYTFEMPSNRSIGQQFTSHEISLAVSVNVFPFHQSRISNF